MDREDDRLLRAALEINTKLLAFVIGFMAGACVFVATLWLVVKGGANVGSHLSLLSQFCPGYRVTYFGSIVGFVYGFIYGYVAGWCIAWLYNRFAYIHGRLVER